MRHPAISKKLTSFFQCLVVEANDARDLPHSVFVLPELNKLRLADGIGSLVSGMVETMNPDFHRAVVGDGIDLKSARNQFARHLAADVVLDAIDKSLPSACQAGLVVVELQVVCQ